MTATLLYAKGATLMYNKSDIIKKIYVDKQFTMTRGHSDE